MFEYVWSLTDAAKRAFIKGLIHQIPVKRRRKSSDSPSRLLTLQFHLKRISGDILPVCKTMFLNTTALTQWFIRSCCKEDSHDSDTGAPRLSYYQRAEDDKQFLVKDFFDKLNKMPSHYCRQNTGKLYLESHFQSIADLYKEYQRKCEEQNRNALSQTTFREMFQKSNLSLHVPRKDQCDVCVSHREGNLGQEKWEKHVEAKNRARQEKESDKKLAQNPVDGTRLCVVCMDLEAVLLAPALKASALYYRTKLSITSQFSIWSPKM